MQAHQAANEQDIEDVSQCLQGNLCRCTGQGLAHQNLLIQTKGKSRVSIIGWLNSFILTAT